MITENIEDEKKLCFAKRCFLRNLAMILSGANQMEMCILFRAHHAEVGLYTEAQDGGRKWEEIPTS